MSGIGNKPNANQTNLSTGKNDIWDRIAAVVSYVVNPLCLPPLGGALVFGHFLVPPGEWWLLVCAVIHLMRSAALRPTLARKRLLATVEASLRHHCRREPADGMGLSDEQRNELLLLVALSGDRSEHRTGAAVVRRAAP